MKIGDKVYYLTEYNWHPAEIVKVGRVNYRIKDSYGNHELVVKPEKIAALDESVCVVWETWKGRNGRGAHRVEREMYPQHRLPANQVGRQDGNGRVTEESIGVLRP